MSIASQKPGTLLTSVHNALRERHYSPLTEEAYVKWIRRLISHCGRRHPLELGADDIRGFLEWLVAERQVGEGTHQQALCAIVFLYRQVLKSDMPWLDQLTRPKHYRHLPVVLSREEVGLLMKELSGIPRLMASLLYGSGLRLMECARLRIKDIDFERRHIVVRQGKGKKDRITLLPTSVRADLQQQLQQVKLIHP